MDSIDSQFATRRNVALQPGMLHAALLDRLTRTLGKNPDSSTPRDFYDALSLAVREELTLRWLATQRRVSQARVNTPKPVWNPDVKQPFNFFDHWQNVPDSVVFDNGFKTQWELFIRHVCEDAPYRWDLLEGAKGVQLVELAQQSWKARRWIDVPALPA